jgi:hypothetical protein
VARECLAAQFPVAHSRHMHLARNPLRV